MQTTRSGTNPRRDLILATNLIIIEAKRINSTDTCLGRLAAYMGMVHKTEQKQTSVIYAAASDGLSFRFRRIE